MERKGRNDGFIPLEPHERAFGFPDVVIGLDTLKKMFCYAAVAPYEVGGVGIVEETESGLFISDIHLIRQTASAAEMLLDDLDLNRFVGECEEPEKIKVQWHSHGSGPVFFSPQDTSTIAGYDMDFAISIVVNKRFEVICRVDLFKPVYFGFRVPLRIRIDVDEELAEKYREEVAEKVCVAETKKKHIGGRFRSFFSEMPMKLFGYERRLK